MSNYKTEVERTERLEVNLTNIFQRIKTEIYKDDNINVENLGMIENAIKNIKSGRRRWASGNSLPVMSDKRGLLYTKLNTLNFKPSVVLIKMDIEDETNIENVMINIENKTKIRYIPPFEYSHALINGVHMNNDTEYSDVRSEYEWKFLTENAFNVNKIVLTTADGGLNKNYIKIKSWIAIE